jgi:acyl-CoA dehydrogenase
LCRLVYRSVEPGNPLGALQQALELAAVAEPLERKLRIEGQKTGRLSALDLPGQIQQARALGILTEPEAQLLADYDRRVMQIIGVDDFAPHELGVGVARTFPRAIAPTVEGDQTCAS